MRLISKVTIVSTLALAIASAPALARAASLSAADAAYLRTAIQTQLGRYAIGSIGAHKATTGALRAVGQAMAADANADNRALRQVAKANGVAPPTKPTLVARYHYSQISSESGRTFDRSFVRAVVIDDREALDANMHEVKSGRNPQLQSIAKKNIHALKSEIGRVQKYTS
jgi:putative membrane protein